MHVGSTERVRSELLPVRGERDLMVRQERDLEGRAREAVRVLGGGDVRMDSIPTSQGLPLPHVEISAATPSRSRRRHLISSEERRLQTTQIGHDIFSQLHQERLPWAGSYQQRSRPSGGSSAAKQAILCDVCCFFVLVP